MSTVLWLIVARHLLCLGEQLRYGAEESCSHLLLAQLTGCVPRMLDAVVLPIIPRKAIGLSLHTVHGCAVGLLH